LSCPLLYSCALGCSQARDKAMSVSMRTMAMMTRLKCSRSNLLVPAKWRNFCASSVVVFEDVCGKSLKAGRDIERGATIVDEWVDVEYVLLRPTKYSLKKDDGVHLDIKSEMRYTNHSFIPNAVVRFPPKTAVDNQDAHKVVLEALDLIPEGSDITIDYTKTESHLAEPFVDIVTGREVK